MLLPFILLGLSICAVWLPAIPIADSRQIPPWTLLFAASIVAGLSANFLQWPAVASLGLLAVAAWSSSRLNNPALRRIATLAAIALALGLALHLLPGFKNPIVIKAATFSPDSTPFTQQANFDKGAAGLLMLALMVPRIGSLKDMRSSLKPVLLCAVLTVAIVMAAAYLVGYVRWNPKWPSVALTFLVVNLLFTCVAEEVFFRGVIQEKLASAFRRSTLSVWLPITISTIMFAIAHFGGGLVYVCLAGIAGLGYSIAYALTRRIEAPVLTHFAVNLVHFVGFTYPAIAR